MVEGGFGAEGTTLLVILLDSGVFIIHMQGGDHPTRNHPCAELAGCTSADAPVKDPPVTRQSSAWVSENSACRIEIWSVTGLAIPHAIRMRQQPQPLP